MDLFPPNIKAPCTSWTNREPTVDHLSSLLPDNVRRFFSTNGKLPLRRHSFAEIPIIEVTPPPPAGCSETRTFNVEINKMFKNTLKLCNRNIRRFSEPLCSTSHLDLSKLEKGTAAEGRSRRNSMPCIPKKNLLQVPKPSNRKKKKRRSSLPVNSIGDSSFPDLRCLQPTSTGSCEKINYLPDGDGGPPKAVHEIFISGLTGNPDSYETKINGFQEESSNVWMDKDEERQTMSSIPKVTKLNQQDVFIMDTSSQILCQIGYKTKHDQPIQRQYVEKTSSIFKNDCVHDGDEPFNNKINNDVKKMYKEVKDEQTNMRINNELIFEQDSPHLAEPFVRTEKRCELYRRDMKESLADTMINSLKESSKENGLCSEERISLSFNLMNGDVLVDNKNDDKIKINDTPLLHRSQKSQRVLSVFSVTEEEKKTNANCKTIHSGEVDDGCGNIVCNHNIINKGKGGLCFCNDIEPDKHIYKSQRVIVEDRKHHCERDLNHVCKKQFQVDCFCGSKEITSGQFTDSLESAPTVCLCYCSCCTQSSNISVGRSEAEDREGKELIEASRDSLQTTKTLNCINNNNNNSNNNIYCILNSDNTKNFNQSIIIVNKKPRSNVNDPLTSSSKVANTTRKFFLERKTEIGHINKNSSSNLYKQETADKEISLLELTLSTRLQKNLKGSRQTSRSELLLHHLKKESSTSYQEPSEVDDLILTRRLSNNNNRKSDILSIREEKKLSVDTDLNKIKTTVRDHTSQATKNINSPNTPTRESVISIVKPTPQQQQRSKENYSCNRLHFPWDPPNNNKVNYRTDTIRVINNSSEQAAIVRTMKSTIIMAMNNEIDEGSDSSNILFHNDDSSVKDVDLKRNTEENEDSILINRSALLQNKNHNRDFVDSSKTDSKNINVVSNTHFVEATGYSSSVDADITVTVDNSTEMSPTRHQLSSVISDVLSGKNPDVTSNLFFTSSTKDKDNTASMFERGKVLYNVKSEDCNLVVAGKEEKLPNVIVDSIDASFSTSSDSYESDENDLSLAGGSGENKMALTKSVSLTGLETFAKKELLNNRLQLKNEIRTVSLHEDSIRDKKLLDALSDIDTTPAASKPRSDENNKPTSKSMEELDAATKSSHHHHRPAATTLATRVSALNRINKEFANAMLRKAVSLVEIQNERLKENVAKWEQRFMSTEILSAPEEDWFPRVSMEDCSACAACRSRSSSYHSLLYDFDTANQFPIYQPTVIDYEEDAEAIYCGGGTKSSENLCDTKKTVDKASNTSTATSGPIDVVDTNNTLPTAADALDVTDGEEQTVHAENKRDTIDTDKTQAPQPTAADTVVSNGGGGDGGGGGVGSVEEDNKTKLMLKLKKEKFMKQSQAAFGSLKDRFRKAKSKV